MNMIDCGEGADPWVRPVRRTIDSPKLQLAYRRADPPLNETQEPSAQRCTSPSLMLRSSSLCLRNSGRVRSTTARRVSNVNLRRPSSLPDPSDPPKLKKSLNQVVQELASLGFSPEVVRDLVKQGNDALNAMREEPSSDKQTTITIQPHALTSLRSGLRLLYEVDNDLGHFVPHLRLIVDKDADMNTAVSEHTHGKDSYLDARRSHTFLP